MNPALAIPQGLGAVDVSEMLTVIGFVSERDKSAKNLPVNVDGIIERVQATLDELVCYAIEKRTAAEFRAAREQVFPKYFTAVLGLSHLVRVMVPKHTLEALSNESFSELEAEFREHGQSAFGLEVRDQAIFTAWTLRKISDTCRQINEAPPPVEKSTDAQLHEEFVVMSMYTRFSLDCLQKSMQLRKAIYPEVLPVVIDGLRAAVNVYALARCALDLRIPTTEPNVSSVEWDEEDKCLLEEATRELIAEPSS
jgi:hypothetical protein